MSSFKRIHDKDIGTPVDKDSIDSTFQTEELGDLAVYREDGNRGIFQFVEIMNDTVSPGDVLAYGDSAPTSYKAEEAASTSNSIKPAGVVYTSATVGQGCWVQKTGPNFSKVASDGSVSADSTIYKSSTDSAQATNDADGAHRPIGHTYKADSGNFIPSLTAYLTFPL